MECWSGGHAWEGKRWHGTRDKKEMRQGKRGKKGEDFFAEPPPPPPGRGGHPIANITIGTTCVCSGTVPIGLT